MAMAFLAAIAAQISSAWINSSHNKALSKKMADLQREYEEKAVLEGIENARIEFAELCTFQREMERQLQLDRLNLIRDNHEQNLIHDAYEYALHKWPLLVPPYVITNVPLTIGSAVEQSIPLNCILATSSDLDFNNKVFHKLEEQIAFFCSKYWNISTNKSIRFFQDAWRDNSKDIGSRHKDIYAHLKNVPTLLISPVLKNDTILFRFYWWGLSPDPVDVHLNDLAELNPEISLPINKSTKFTSDIVEIIMAECTPKLEAFISFFADLYYWNFYNFYPSLPRLILNRVINLPLNDIFVKSLSDGFIDSFIQSNNIDIHNNLFYLKEVSSLRSFKREELQKYIIEKIAKILRIAQIDNLSLTDLIIKYNLYTYISSYDIAAIEDMLKNNIKEETNSIIYNNIVMDSNIYLIYKNQLLGLLKKVQAISYLPKENKLEFEKIEHKIQEDQFRIALIGEYQGGKSTTFDALCEGREISPRGNNIKTSSCKITATNLSSDEDEYAWVIWKSDVELVKTMSPILESINPELFGYNLSSKENFSYIQYVDLHNNSHLDILKDAISSESSKELKDIVLISKFILCFYDKLSDIKSKNRFTIEEASKLMTFPKDLYKRYNESNGNVEVFTEEEALFAFVQTVNCHIHSNQLGELGCSFVDCPGLFASDYDTSIALETIDSSDAVLYLLDGDKQMGQDDESAIRTIFKDGLLGCPDYKGYNIFFAVNQRKPDYQTSFVDDDLSQIQAIGFERKKLPIFNAWLFYYAQFGIAYLNNTLDEHTITRFLNTSSHSYGSVQEKWVKDVSRCLMYLELDEEYNVDSLTMDSAKMLMHISKSNILFGEIKDYAIRNRATNILIDNGAKKILDGLKSIDQALQNKESAARKDVAERADEVKKAKDDLEKFCEKVSGLINEAFPEKEKRDYIEKIYSRYFLDSSAINSIALEVTKNLLTYIRKSSTKWTALTSKIGTKDYKKKQTDKLQTDIKAFFEQAFNVTFTSIIGKWLNVHYADKDVDFKNVIFPLAERLGEKIKNEWNEAIKEAPVLSVLCPSTIGIMTIISKDQVVELSVSKNQVSNNTVTGTSNAAIGDVVSQIISPIISTIVGVVVFHMLDLMLTGGIAAFYSLLAAALTQIGLRSPKKINTADDLGKKGRQLYDQIKANLYEVLLSSEVKETLCFGPDGLISIVNQDVDRYVSFYNRELDDKRSEFEDNRKKAEEEYLATKEELEKIASEAKRIREEEVLPLENCVLKYIADIKNANE